jgi:integron integrase
MDARPRLLDQVRDRLRTLYYSYRTEQSYLDWIRRFILYSDRRHPSTIGGPEVERFLTHLAVERGVSASTQSQALAALLFLYRQVLQIELPWLENVVRAKPSRRLPIVLTTTEVRDVLAHLRGEHCLVANLLYGSELRLMEALRLRVKDVNFAYRQVLVRDGKGAKDRVTVLPAALVEPLRLHLEQVRDRHRIATERGYGGVELPHALARKYPRGAPPVAARSILTLDTDCIFMHITWTFIQPLRIHRPWPRTPTPRSTAGTPSRASCATPRSAGRPSSWSGCAPRASRPRSPR